MTSQEILLLISAALLLICLPGTLTLALLTYAGSQPARSRPGGSPLRGRVAIIVPAHNEAQKIMHTLANLTRLARQDGECDVVVVADNCTDNTARVARYAKAIVLERNEPSQHGKGYALDYAFRELADHGYVAYAVIDADTLADDNFLSSLRRHLGNGRAAMQARYTVLNGHATPRTRLAEIALAAFNILRPRARARLGLSAGILGNGFALRHSTLQSLPYTAASVVEDLEYHLQLVNAGLRVVFADDTCVRGEMPTGAQGIRSQRTRWEGGRLRMAIEHSPALLAGILRGQWRLLEPLADLLLPPLAFHVLLLLAAAALASLSAPAWPLYLALGGLAVVAVHVFVAMHVARLPATRLLVLGRLPAYLLWKLSMLTAICAGATRQSPWVRTNRHGD